VTQRKILRLDFTEPSDGPMTSWVAFVTKPDKKSVRLCCDYRLRTV